MNGGPGARAMENILGPYSFSFKGTPFFVMEPPFEKEMPSFNKSWPRPSTTTSVLACFYFQPDF